MPIVTSSPRSKVTAPGSVSVPVPSAVSLSTRTVPSITYTPPLNVLFPFRIKVLTLSFVNPHEPPLSEMSPASVAVVPVSGATTVDVARLMSLPMVTPSVNVREVEPRLLTISVPEPIALLCVIRNSPFSSSVPPEYELLPLRINVPSPVFVIPLVPLS